MPYFGLFRVIHKPVFRHHYYCYFLVGLKCVLNSCNLCILIIVGVIIKFIFLVYFPYQSWCTRFNLLVLFLLTSIISVIVVVLYVLMESLLMCYDNNIVGFVLCFKAMLILILNITVQNFHSGVLIFSCYLTRVVHMPLSFVQRYRLITEGIVSSFI